MYITNTEGCLSGGTWEAYNVLKDSWTLNSGDGTKTVYAKFKNAGDIETNCVSDDIVLDATPPPVPNTLSLFDPATSPNNNSTPTIQIGGVNEGDIIILYADNCITPVASDTATGTTIELVSSALLDDTYNFHAAAEDSIGNLSDCSTASVEYILNTSVPSSPTIALHIPTSTPGNNTTPTFRISGVENGYSIELYKSTGSGCDDLLKEVVAGGAIEDISTEALAEGSYSMFAKVKNNGAGTPSDCSTQGADYNLDLTAPDPPTALTLTDPIPASGPPYPDPAPSFDISGVVDGDTIGLYFDADCTNLAALDTASDTVINITTSDIPSYGTHRFYANATDPAGNKSACSTASIEYEFFNDARVTINSKTPDDPAGVRTRSTDVSLTLASPDAAQMYITNTEGCLSDGTWETFASVKASWTLPTGDGTKTVYTKFKNAGGLETDCVSDSIILDTTAPDVPNALTLYDPALSPNNDSTPIIQVEGVVKGDTIILYSDTCTTEVASNVVASGTTINLTSSVLTDGTYDFYAKSKDAVGNLSSCSTATVQYILNTTTPAAPTIVLFDPSSSPGNDTTPTFRINGVSDGYTVGLYLSEGSGCDTFLKQAIAGSTTVDITTDALDAGTYSLFAKIDNNGAGTPSSCSIVGADYTLDLTAPDPPSAIVLTDPDPGSGPPYLDTTPTFNISGTVSGDTIGLYFDNSCSNLAASDIASSTTIILTSSDISSYGTHTYYANATDLAGNKSTCSTANAVYELYNDATITINSKTPDDPAGTHTRNTDVSLSLVSTSASQMYITNTSGCATGGSWEAFAASKINWALASGDGTQTVYVKFKNTAGLETDCINDDIILDTTPPAAPNALSLYDPALSPNNDPTPTIQVRGVSSGDMIYLYSDNCTTQVASASASETTINLTSSALADGVYNFHAKAQDPIGNISSCSTAFIEYDLDTSTPDTPTIALYEPVSVPNNDATPTFRIEGVVDGYTIGLYKSTGGDCDTLLKQAVATGITVDITADALTEGAYSIYAKVLNNGANTPSECSIDVATYVLDLTAPDAPSAITLTDPIPSGGPPYLSTTPSFDISGVVDGDSVRLYFDSSCSDFVSTGIASGSVINITSTELSSYGTYTYYANATDAAGNISTCSTANASYKYDVALNAYDQVVLSDGPRLYWRLHDANGPTALDETGSGNTGTYVGTPTFKQSPLAASGNSVYLPNGTHYLKTGDPDNINWFNFTTEDFTFEFWIKAVFDHTGVVFNSRKIPVSNNDGYVLYFTSNRTLAFDVHASGNQVVESSTSLYDNTIYHIVLVRQGTNVKIYANDILIMNKNSYLTTMGVPPVNSRELKVGIHWDNTSFNMTGFLDGFAIYDKALIPEQISAHYSTGATPPAAPNSLSLNDPATSPNNDSTPTIQVGGVNSGDTVFLYSNNSCTAGVATGTASGTTINLTTSNLSDGIHNFYAKVRNSAGYISSCSTATVEYVSDTSTPSAPTIALLDPASSPNTDSTPTFRISGVASGYTVGLYSSTGSGCDTLLKQTEAAGTTIDFTTDTLSDGTYSMFAKVENNGANTPSNCSSTEAEYHLDLTPPDPPSAITLTDPTPGSSPYTDPTPSFNISGVVSGDTIGLYFDSSCSNSAASGTASGSSISLTSNNIASYGTYTYYADATDPFGNKSTCSTANVAYEYRLISFGGHTTLVNGLLSYWKLDEILGSSILDEQGSNIGTNHSTTETTDGIFSNGLLFNRSVGNYVDFGTASPILDARQFSISFWFKRA